MNDLNYLTKTARRKKRPKKSNFYLSTKLFGYTCRTYKIKFKNAVILQIQKDMNVFAKPEITTL